MDNLDVSAHAETRWRQRIGEGCLARSAIRLAVDRAEAERSMSHAERLCDPRTGAVLIVEDGTVVTVINGGDES